ncbi:DUF1348 family protein [Rhizobium lentis]|uniref:DUF1348 family protein n=1 Tax=Rhizobium lentis TaxID=1138194 RepID=UPI001C82D864|nr:DUF1348 family protein [Rhizobium lentis]
MPPFSWASAAEKIRIAEDGWNSRNPQRLALAYSHNSRWRNRSEFINGREAIIGFLTRKWQRELACRLRTLPWIARQHRTKRCRKKISSKRKLLSTYSRSRPRRSSTRLSFAACNWL